MLPALSALLVVLHLGPLHPVEQGLTVLLAFGPFVLLGVVIWVRRRQDAREDERQDEPQDSVDQAPAQRER